MDAEASFSSPPVFDGDNYETWAVRMETYLNKKNSFNKKNNLQAL